MKNNLLLIVTLIFLCPFAFGQNIKKIKKESDGKYNYDRDRVDNIRNKYESDLLSSSQSYSQITDFGLFRIKQDKLTAWVSYETGELLTPFTEWDTDAFNKTSKTAIVSKYVDDNRVYALFNTDFEEVIPFGKYESISSWHDLFIVRKKDNTQALITAKGGIRLPFQKFDIHSKYESGDNFIVDDAAEDDYNKKYGAINKKGELIVPIVFDDEDVLEKINDYQKLVIGECSDYDPKGYRIYKIGEGWLVDISFDYIVDYGTEIKITKGIKKGVIDREGNIEWKGVDKAAMAEERRKQYDFVGKTSYVDSKGNYGHQKVVRVKKGDKYGFIDANTADLIIPLAYDDAKDFIPELGVAIVKKDGNYGMITEKNETYFSFAYDWIDVQIEYDAIIVIYQDQFGFFYTDGSQMFDQTFQTANYFDNGISVVQRDGYYGTINNKGEYVLPFEYTRAAENGYNDGMLAVGDDNLLGFANLQGQLVVPLKYTWVDKFKNGRCAVQLANGQYLIINKKGEQVAKGIDLAALQKIIPTERQSKYLIKKDGKWGIIDASGILTLDCQFTMHTLSDDNGCSIIKGKEGRGLIYKGKLVMPPIFDRIDYFYGRFYIGYKDDKYCLYEFDGDGDDDMKQYVGLIFDELQVKNGTIYYTFEYDEERSIDYNNMKTAENTFKYKDQLIRYLDKPLSNTYFYVYNDMVLEHKDQQDIFTVYYGSRPFTSLHRGDVVKYESDQNSNVNTRDSYRSIPSINYKNKFYNAGSVIMLSTDYWEGL